MPGIPRATYMPFPFQIVQGTSKIMMVYEFAGANRTIHMDQVPAGPVDSWMGHSVGHWDGDTLVVDVTSQVDQTWFDRAGNFHSEALHVVERFTRTDRDHLKYDVTIEDPESVHAAVEDDDAALPPRGTECCPPRVQVRGVFGRAPVRASSHETEHGIGVLSHRFTVPTTDWMSWSELIGRCALRGIARMSCGHVCRVVPHASRRHGPSRC